MAQTKQTTKVKPNYNQAFKGGPVRQQHIIENDEERANQSKMIWEKGKPVENEKKLIYGKETWKGKGKPVETCKFSRKWGKPVPIVTFVTSQMKMNQQSNAPLPTGSKKWRGWRGIYLKAFCADWKAGEWYCIIFLQWLTVRDSSCLPQSGTERTERKLLW